MLDVIPCIKQIIKKTEKQSGRLTVTYHTADTPTSLRKKKTLERENCVEGGGKKQTNKKKTATIVKS